MKIRERISSDIDKFDWLNKLVKIEKLIKWIVDKVNFQMYLTKLIKQFKKL
jgi:hypothetical protein